MRGGRWRRVRASAGLLAIVATAVALLGGAVAGLLVVTIGDTPAAEREAAESDDVVVGRCDRELRRMTAVLRFTNDSTEASSYFVDLDFVGRARGRLLESVPVVVEALRPGATRRVTVHSTEAPRHPTDCRIADVDRLAT